MSSRIEMIESPPPVAPAPDRDWAAHRGALQTPELRSALAELHASLEIFFKDPEQP